MEWVSLWLVVAVFVVFATSWRFSHSFWTAIFLGGVTVGIGLLFSKIFPVLSVPETLTFGTIFVLGSIGFWALTVSAAIVVLSLIEHERTVSAAFSVIAALLLLQFFGDIKIFGYISAHPWWSLFYAFLYFLVGALYSLIKWFLFAHDEREKTEKLTEEFLKTKGIKGTVVPDDLKYEWYFFVRRGTPGSSKNYGYEDHPTTKFLRERGISGNVIPAGMEGEYKTYAEEFYKSRYERVEKPTFAPSYKEHKKEIILWIAHWPWSLAWTLIDDPIKRLLKFIYRKLARAYEEIARYAFRDVDKKLPPTTKIQ